MTTVRPGRREVGEGVSIDPPADSRVTVGPITVTENGTETFMVTVAPVIRQHESPGQYL